MWNGLSVPLVRFTLYIQVRSSIKLSPWYYILLRVSLIVDTQKPGFDPSWMQSLWLHVRKALTCAVELRCFSGYKREYSRPFPGRSYRSPWRYWQSDNGRWSVFVSMLRALAILESNSFTRSIGVRPELDTRSSGWALRYRFTLKVECWLIEDLHRDEQSIVIPRQVSNSNLRRRTWTNTSSLLVVAWVRYICGLCFSRRSLVSVRSHRLLVLFSYTHVTF